VNSDTLEPFANLRFALRYLRANDQGRLPIRIPVHGEVSNPEREILLQEAPSYLPIYNMFPAVIFYLAEFHLYGPFPFRLHNDLVNGCK
jgi:hypothetical protein